MKKTFTINLNGIVFHIDDDAYQQLSAYLDDVRAHLATSDDKDEIMCDIEARIAELFTEKIRSKGCEVVSIDMVRFIMETLGSPSDYGDGTDAEPVMAGDKETKTHRRFYRDVDNALLGGVLGGLAAMLGWDAVWLRLAFILLAIVGYGWPVVLYLVLWFIVPPARTVAQKLEMRGQPVTIDNIKERIEDGLADGTPGSWTIRALRVIFKIIAGFFVFVFGFVVVMLVIALLALFAGLLFGLSTATTGIMGGLIDWLPFYDLHPWQNTMLTVSAVLLVACPLIVLVAGLLSLLSKRKWTTKRFNLSFLIVWLLALGVMVVTAFTTPVVRAAVYDLFHFGKVADGHVYSFRSDESYEVMEYPAFTVVELDGMVNLTLKGDDTCQVAMRHHTAQLEAYVMGNTLHIDNDAPYAVDVELSNPKLTRLASEGVCNIVCQDTLRAPAFTLQLDEVAKVTLLYVGENLTIQCADASKVTVAGRTDHAVFQLSDTGKLDAMNLIADNVELHCSDVSKADVHAVRTLSVDAAGLSKITYKGNPKLTQNNAAGYQIRQK